jgi:tetratricopeptide (TPR) repeat protein
VALGFILLGATTLLRAEDAPEVVDNDISAYHVALVDYKAGKFQEAYDAMAPSNQDVPPSNLVQFDVLESKVLTELKRYDEGEKLLRGILTPNGPVEVQLALGDLLLRKHSFDRAAKYYSLALQAKPNDPDITLKLVYAKIGVSDLVEAGEYASHLSPLDPKNPYDTHASYYFAKAALAQATGNSQGADDDIQAARTIYGVTVTNRYLKTYLEVFASSEKNPNSDITPPPLVTPAPSSAKP